MLQIGGLKYTNQVVKSDILIEVWMQGCRSCSECSRENGCLRCSDRLFLFLHRDGMSHHGSCLHSCPAGHYGLRGTDANRCIKCRAPECERCFDKDFCTKCKRGFLLYKGKCLSSCPEEDCVFSTAGNWAEWSPCLYNGLSCGVRWGRQNRTRVLSWRTPEELSELCPPQSESRKCRLKKRCRKGKRCYMTFALCKTRKVYFSRRYDSKDTLTHSTSSCTMHG
uniref:R-spondin 4 n=1 Tax=Astyanax mexicanus TaxID=7994 RepID=A0A8B9L6L0_ASTMX